MTVLGAYGPLSPSWFEARRWRIGASEVAVILGMSPWQTSAGLMAQKLDGTQVPDSPAMLRGRALETAAIPWAAAKWPGNDWTFDPARSAATYVHGEYDWALANPDFILTDDTLIEVKTTHDRATEDGWGKAGSDVIPLAYQTQIQWACGVIGLDSWRLLVIHGATNGRPDLDIARYKGAANPRQFAAMAARAARWHDQLIAERDRTAA